MGGRLAMRLKPPRYAEVSVSPGAAAGMALLQALLDEARMRVELRLQPGEILLADNTAVLHGRTPMPRDGVRKLNRLLFDGTGAVAPALTFGFLPEAA
jgi:alpha-ketoglutarate-dependent taurine dioxygenase